MAGYYITPSMAAHHMTAHWGIPIRQKSSEDHIAGDCAWDCARFCAYHHSSQSTTGYDPTFRKSLPYRYLWHYIQSTHCRSQMV
jgi:hypothetical protein